MRNIVTDSYSPADCSKPVSMANEFPLHGIPDNLPIDSSSVLITGSLLNKTELKDDGLKNVFHNRLVTPSAFSCVERLLMIGGLSSLDTDPFTASFYIETALHKIDLPKYTNIHVFAADIW